ncbi:MAG TPA: hypothetical protein PLF68_12535 [Nitrospira sp.]|nr:hypothetical protein [Nitrospira sp.]
MYEDDPDYEEDRRRERAAKIGGLTGFIGCGIPALIFFFIPMIALMVLATWAMFTEK